MQEENQQEPSFLRTKLLEAVDAEYNVKDMTLILEVLGKLEVLAVSKEILETTRLGKTVNEFRRKVKDAVLAKRLKELVKKWREKVIPTQQQIQRPIVSPSLAALSTSSRVSPAGSFNSNSSLSPRIVAVTNHANNNNNSHANNNNRSPNHRNPQLLSSSYATASPLLNTRCINNSSNTSPYLNSISSNYSAVAVNGTLGDPTLALDDISRDSYASRGSDQSDGYLSNDHKFSITVPENDISMDNGAANCSQPKRKRRKKQNEFFQDTEAILREKIAQAQAEKAAKAARERELQLKAQEALAQASESEERQRWRHNVSLPDDKLANNEFVENYLKSQNELLAKMVGDIQEGAQDVNQTQKAKKKKPNENSFPSEQDILAQLPPIDEEILKEFENFEYDTYNSYNQETDIVKSLSPPRKLIDWGDSDDEMEEVKNKGTEAETQTNSQQNKVISENNVDLTTKPLNEEDIDKYIKDSVPSLNGNFDKDGQFREWHETLTVESYKGEPLHILPYTVIDF